MYLTKYLRNLFNILLFLGVLLLAACSTNRKAHRASNVKLKKQSSEYLLKKMGENVIEVDWLSAKAKITYKDPFETAQVYFQYPDAER